MSIDHEAEIRRTNGIRSWTATAVALFPMAAGLIDLLWVKETYTQSVGIDRIAAGLTTAAGLLHLSSSYIQGQHLRANSPPHRDNP